MAGPPRLGLQGTGVLAPVLGDEEEIERPCSALAVAPPLPPAPQDRHQKGHLFTSAKAHCVDVYRTPRGRRPLSRGVLRRRGKKVQLHRGLPAHVRLRAPFSMRRAQGQLGPHGAGGTGTLNPTRAGPTPCRARRQRRVGWSQQLESRGGGRLCCVVFQGGAGTRLGAGLQVVAVCAVRSQELLRCR